MNARKILIADKDPGARQKLADFFLESNYQVETTGSAAYVVARIIQKQQPIVLLGSRFEEKISAADVISLLRGCNKELRIILVSDENSPEMLRKVREEGIFLSCVDTSEPARQRGAALGGGMCGRRLIQLTNNR